MIRFFTIGRSRPELSLAQYQEGLLHGHAPLVRDCGGFRRNCLEYRQNHIRGAVGSDGLLRTEEDPAFHNCSEFWYDGVDALLRAYHNEDYFRMLRPDENRWSDSQARLAFLATETRVWEAERPNAAGAATKVLILRRRDARQVASEFASDRQAGLDYPGFFDRCLRYSENSVTGRMDFATATLRDANDLPYTHLSELWFASPDEAQGAFSSTDGRRLLASGVFPFCAPETTLALWAREHSIF